jgi:hypothetical protein
METNLIYASAGGIRTYPYLLDNRHAMQMRLMVMLLHYVYMLNTKHLLLISFQIITYANLIL